MTAETTPGPLHDLTVQRVPLDTLQHYGRNPRRGDVDVIMESLATNGQYKPIVARAGTHEVLAGNHTLKAARELGWADIAVSYVDVDDDAAARIVLVDNRSNDLAGYDDALLQAMLHDLPDLAGTGYTAADLADYTDDAEGAAQNSSLVERFGMPPFTVLDARGGEWKKRKAAWKDLGIESELGRADQLVYDSPQTLYANWYEVKNDLEAKAGRTLTGDEVLEQAVDRLQPMIGGTGTSIFDPVLTELLYRWFSPPAGHILDPWAGGSVRGLVASRLGRRYTGVELRPEQVDANREQAARLTDGPLPAQLAAAPGEDDRDGDASNVAPYYEVGDSTNVLLTLPRDGYDMLIGCPPPYYDLETYSDDPADMSNLAPEEFDRVMLENVRAAADRLKPNSYAVFIVGAVRNRHGHLMDMRSLMVRAAGEAGLTLHNDAVLVTSVGTVAFRAARAFLATRVLGRTHQDVLVFLKGDRRAAGARMGEVEAAATLEALDRTEVTDDGEDGAAPQ